MGDPVTAIGAAASITALIDFTTKAIKYAIDFVKAKEDRQELVDKLGTLALILTRLDHREQEARQSKDAWYQGLLAMLEPDGTLTQLKNVLGKMLDELGSSDPDYKLKRLRVRFGWHWDKDEFEGMLKDITRLCGEINLVLGQDHFDLSKKISFQVDNIRDESEVQLELTRLIQQYVVKIRDEGNDTNARVNNIDDRTARLEIHQRMQEKEAEMNRIEAWLSPLTDLARQDKLFEDCFAVGQWFLKEQAFKCWTGGRPWQLRCYGDAGSGKTMLSSIVINHLQEQYETQTTPVICLYLDHKESIMHTPENLLGSLLKQFIQLKDSDPVSPDLRRSYQRARRRGAKPGLRNIRRLLHAELLIYDRVYLIVDAMDECSSKSRDLLKTELGKLQKLQPGKLSLMITSREFEAEACDIKCDHCGAANIKIYFHCYDCDDGEFDLCQSCKDMEVYCRDKTHKLFEPYNSVEVRIRIPNADLERYVREEIGKEMGDESSDFRDKRRHPNRLDTSRFQRICQKAPELLERIPSVVVERADGKFLFAKLFMDSIKAKQTVKQIRATLNSFPDELDTIYQEAMQRIEDENTENDRATALKVFSLIVCAHRPLCLAELQHVLAVEPGDVDFDQESVCDKELILSITGGLVTIDNDENAVVRLVHSTLHAYLSDTRDRWFPKAEVEMANACLIYMSFDAFSRPCYKIEDFDSKRKDYPFIAYASQYWGDHVRDTGPDQRIEATALRFLDDPLRIAAYIQAAWCTDAHGPVSWDVRKGVDPLHICAWFGLSSVVSALDQGDLDVDVQDSTYGQTPLMYACRQGHVEVVRQLLDLNASVNIVSARGRTAMFEAVEQNQEEIVRLLLRKEELDINAVQPKESNRTALMLAAYMGHLKIVLDLLEHPDININQQDAKGYTTLSLATIKDFELIVRLLLTKPEIDVNLADYTAGRSALILAAERDECAIVELLLQHHADPSRKDHQGGGTAMLRAIDFGRISVLESMLPYKVDLRSLDDDGRGLVHGASTNGYPDIIRWLKQQDLDLNLQDKNGFTPLHDASRNGKREVVGTLLELGADGTIKDNFGRTPLIVAWQYGQTQILDILKDKSTNEQGSSTPMLDAESLPIWSLVKQGHSDLITKAIAAGKCDLLEREPGSDDTALHCAVQADKLQILQLLLQDAKMSPDCVNRYRRTPLHIAAIDSKLDAATVLTENHASLDLEDQWGHTPLSIAQSDENQYEMHFPVAIALIEAGADTKLVNIQKMFFAAVELGRVKAVQILLDRGADVLGTNPDGKKARELAKEAGDGDLMQVLKTSKSFHYKVDERKLEESLDMVDSFPSVPLEEPHGFVPFRPLRSDPIAI